MPENVLQTVQKVVQDLVAPELRELKGLAVDLQKQMDQRFEALDAKFTARLDFMDEKLVARLDFMDKRLVARLDFMDKRLSDRFEAQDRLSMARDEKTDAQFRAILATFNEFKAQSELLTVKLVSQVSERVTALETQRQ